MSSQTFKAQMAVGSWSTTPLYPGLSDVIKIIENQISSGQDEDLKSRSHDSDSDIDDGLELN
jgi:hypothetical protein